MTLTNKQWLAIAMAVLGVVSLSTTQMADFLGPALAKNVASAASFVNSILAAIMAAITGQVALVNDVAKMPEVKEIKLEATPAARTLEDSTDDNVRVGTP